MAVHWMDVARYADSYGYQDDNIRTQWPWRDWVIGAFNENMPFDRFTIEQLAGDLLDESNRYKTLPATGFLGLGPWYYDNGAVEITLVAPFRAAQTQQAGLRSRVQFWICQSRGAGFDRLVARDLQSSAVPNQGRPVLSHACRACQEQQQSRDASSHLVSPCTSIPRTPVQPIPQFRDPYLRI